MKIDYKSFSKHWTKPEPNQFPTGSRVYKGYQGSGKTLSMVKYARDIVKEFPDVAIFSNIRLYGFEQLDYSQEEDSDGIYYTRHSGNYQFIHDDEILRHALLFRNGDKGVLILLDEAHLFFNKKTGISLDVLTAISQQRKDKKRLVFSSQIWEELDISLRKQVKQIVSCNCIFKKFQHNTIYDGETLTWQYNSDGSSGYNAKKLYSELFKHNDELYSSYNTYQKILTNQQYSRQLSSNSSNFLITNTGTKSNSLFSAKHH